MNEEKEVLKEDWKTEAQRTIQKQKQGTTLHDVYEVYKKYLYLEDTKRIDIVLATSLSNKLEGIPIWLIVVGPSGDAKSMQINALTGYNTFTLHNMTSKTLVNGYKDKSKHPDLAPKLDGKIIIISDMAQLLKLPPSEKGELWGQLRDLYDGFAGKSSGQGTDTKYSNLRVTLIAGSTPVIDGQILVHQDLGTRELIWRTQGSNNKHKVMEKCFENEEFENEIKHKLNEVTVNYLKNTEIRRNFIRKDIIEQIKEIALYIALMRASGEYDSFTNELRNDVYPEEPTRIAKQLKRIYICLMSLSEDYPEERAIEILWHLAKSSCFPLRIKVYEYLLCQNKELSTSKVAETLKIGKSTAQRELGLLWNIGLVNCRKEETSYPGRFYDYWSINDSNKFNIRMKCKSCEKYKKCWNNPSINV